MANKGLIPPGLAYLADNITNKHNLLEPERTPAANGQKGSIYRKRPGLFSLPDAATNIPAIWKL